MSPLETGELEIGDRTLAAWEIASVVSSGLIVEWISSSIAGESRLLVSIPIALAFAFMIVSHRLHRETLRELGFRVDNFIRAARLLLLPMLIAGIACFIIGRLFGGRLNFGGWHDGTPLIAQLTLGVAWGFVQQYVLQSFINRRAQTVFGKGWLSVLLVASVFALLHLPNLGLAVATFVGGIVWAIVYQRAPNIFALATSHSLMTWVLVATLPSAWFSHLRIGFKYFG